MEIKISESPIKGKVLYADTSNIYYYFKGKIIIADSKYEKIKTFYVPAPFWMKVLTKIRIIERFFHNDVRWAYLTSKKELIFSCRKGIYKYTFSNGLIVKEEVPVKGRPLSFCAVKNIKNLCEGIIIGDYTLNDQNEEVNAFFRSEESGEWKKLFTFSAGSVRHIHKIFCKENNLYVLTGDMDSQSGIWKVSDDFKSLRPILVGKQIYRSCQILDIKDKEEFFYLTDSPDEINHIISLKNGTIHKENEIRGTCIYGEKIGENLIFSTTVEPSSERKNIFKYWLSNSPGKGIKDKNFEINILFCNGEIKKVAEFQHDGLPLRLFQYANATFSYGGKDFIYFTVQCCKKSDQKVFKVEFLK